MFAAHLDIVRDALWMKCVTPLHLVSVFREKCHSSKISIGLTNYLSFLKDCSAPSPPPVSFLSISIRTPGPHSDGPLVKCAAVK